MGLGHLNRKCPNTAPAALDLLPWWGFQVYDPERDGDRFVDLACLLTGTCNDESAGRSGDSSSPLSILHSALPLEPATVLAHKLGRKTVQEGRRKSIPEGLVAGFLWTLGTLMERAEGTGIRPVLVHTASQLLVNPTRDDSGRIIRIIGAVAARHRLEELAEPLAAAVRNDDPCVSLEVPGYLSRLGEPGLEALRQLRPSARFPNHAELRAARAALFENDFDGLVPFLESDAGWRVRGATARLLGQLARLGHPSGAVLEMLLSRARTEEDADTRAVMGDGIGIAVRNLGTEGVDLVLETLRDKFDDGHGEFLLDALLLAGPDCLNPVAIEHLRAAAQGSNGMAEKPRKQAINRLLSWQEGYPVCLMDWTVPSVYRLLQWEDLPLPPAVRNWFSPTPDIPIDQLLAGQLTSEEKDVLGYALAQSLRQKPSEVLPIVELSCVQALVLGHSPRWAALCGVLAGSHAPVGLHPAELRAALGIGAGVPLEPDWAAAGRLLAVASHPVDQAEGALSLLAGMGPDFRELARYALATTPPPSEKHSALGSLPDGTRLGPSRLDPSPVGGIPIRLPNPSDFPTGLHLLFDETPQEWTVGAGCLKGLESMSLHQLDFSRRLARWGDPEFLREIVALTPTLQLQRAILAAVACADEDLNRIGIRVASLSPDSVLDGPLGPLVEIHRRRGTQLNPESQIPAATSPDLLSGADDLIQELEDLLND